MKIVFTSLLLCLFSSYCFSQTNFSKITGASNALASGISSLPSLGNVTAAKNAIMGKLGPALALTSVEKPSVSGLINTFLQNKVEILPLLNGEKADYYNKLASLQTDLFGKLKGILSATQYSKLLALKPMSPTPGNSISNLFY